MTTAPQIDPVSVPALAGNGGSPVELVRGHASELLSLLSLQDAQSIQAEGQPKVVEDGAPKLLPTSGVERVLQNLLRERVSIRDSVTILEPGSMRQAIRRNVVETYFSGTVEAAMESTRKEPGEEARWIGVVAAPHEASPTTIGSAA